MCIGFKHPHFSPSSSCFGLFLVNHIFEDSVQTIINSNLQSLLYDVASMINYSKEPLDGGIVDSPPLKQIFCPSPSPLKRVAPMHDCGQTPPLSLVATWCLTSGFGCTSGNTKCTCPRSSPQHIAHPCRHCPIRHTS